MIILLAFLLATSPLSGAEPVKNFPLVNQEGKPFQLHDLKGSSIFISFVFTRCPMPKMCPLTITRNRQILRKWKDAKSTAPLHFLLVTLDPAFDTPTVLKQFAKQRELSSSHFTLATGSPQVLSDLASEFNVMGVPSEGTITHNMKSILLGPDLKEIAQYKDNEWNADQVMKDLPPNRKL